MAKDAKNFNAMHWSGDVFTEEPSPELQLEHTVNEYGFAAVWAFKIFESIGACATHADESDMHKYRALASILGAGRIRENMITDYWFEGRELAVLYTALCNMQTGFLDKSRMNLEKTLMRNALEQRDPENTINSLRCAIKSQASIMVTQVGELMSLIDGALNDNHRILLTVG